MYILAYLMKIWKLHYLAIKLLDFPFKVVLLKKLIMRKMQLKFWNVHSLEQLLSWIFSW